ncbi:p-loop containing nucleoside triphosphate hydrolase [Venustampulla echinocandica]|uniref:DNA helicase n=1 Tax=Venustampulla echinocandica TaxID=2656787 RepID=A0A370TH66_9HELO|nr:p-loop containing nucleoside triphosphate hydrolase [Venustampulla echinocandica]RDL34539.1 p-loop containing nucleoside triphosphate hydrolase [Venustampulla echinocandica]
MTQTASDAQESQATFGTEPPPPSNIKPTLTPFSADKPATDEIPKTNGHHDDNSKDEGPPAKKRRVSETAPSPRRKLESPPWKKSVADGPSSFTQDGIRKSGRTNRIPLELQPPSAKRQTRGAVQKTYSVKGKFGNANGTHQTRDTSNQPVNGSKKTASAGTLSSHLAQKSPSKSGISPKRYHRKSMPSEPKPTPGRQHRRLSAPKTPQSAPSRHLPERSRRSERNGDTGQHDDSTRRSSLKEEVHHGESPKAKLSRIKFRVKPASLPLTHPGLVLPRPKRYATLEEFLDAGRNIPIEAGGLRSLEDGPKYTSGGPIKDAALMLRLEEAAKPGGLLSPEVCSIYEPPEPEHIPEQYAHRDHMNRAAIEFRRLMFIEQRKHRASAKRLAEACRDEWYRRQPKSAEQLEAEEAKAAENRYRFLVKTLQATWGNVRAEVNRQRLLEWEAQEQDRVRKALNEAVDKSTLKLQAQGAFRDSELPTDEEESGESDEDGEPGSDSESSPEDRESNMSSTASDADEEHATLDGAEDENLTQEQLRQKYSSLPSVPAQTEDVDMADADESLPTPGSDLEDIFDDSDESIDMDDDLGSSDEERGSADEDASDEDDEESEDPGESSLLGFLAPSDIQKEIELDQANPESTLEPGSPASKQDKNEDVELLDTAEEQPSEREPLVGSSETPTEPNTAGLESVEPAPAPGSDHSSLPTPRTTQTKPSEVDSSSSVDAHQISRQATQSSTPQPGSLLKTPIPFLLRGTLREYQHYGLDWLAGLYANNTNGILADEMGLGKTIQTIALLAHLACEHQVWGPHLIIVPTSVILNWEMEFKKWCPGFKILSYYGSIEERRKKRIGWRDDDSWNVCITSYQIVLRDQQVLKRRAWHYMILDEAHNIKNFQSQRWQAMLTFNTRARLLLTGTPLQNNLTELWSLLYFLMPSDGTEQGVGGFANLKEFQDWFKKPSEQILEHGREKMDDEAKAIIAKLHKVLRPYLLRRLKADVEKQMPAKYEHVEFCRLSKRQRELYDSFLSREDTRETLGSGNYLSIINCLMQLRKVCNHPDLFLDRPIMTSFPMQKSAIGDFEIKERLVRRLLGGDDPMTKVSLEFLNLVPTKHERLSGTVTARSAMLSAQRVLMDMREAQRNRAQNALTNLDPSTAKSNLVYLESASRWGRFEELQHCVYLNALRRQQKPIYGKQLVELLTIGVNDRPFRPKPQRRDQWLTWLHNKSPALASMVPTLQFRAETLESTVRKFACVTPPVVAKDITSFALTRTGVKMVKTAIDTSAKDPFHEARMGLSIQFPDKRLLQYDCGKLQTLDKLLRKLQAGGHRALIFTQMTKVLDILEQFLNIHGHKYLRLDGNTKVEQRQILTDRFNNDTRILAFILSSRSGGLGINLTGADTVIFYDLDWNPAMDKQCQDRCHRIGQTRDVHIYRLVSEHTIEANILRKANQKRMLDDVVIQEGEFTTDYFNKISVQDVMGEDSGLLDGDAAASAAMDRVLGGPDNSNNVQRVLAQAEDREDVAAARVAERELEQTDAADFDENAVTASATPAAVDTPQEVVDSVAGEGTPVAYEMNAGEEGEEDELNAWGKPIKSTDDYMLKFMASELKNTPVELPKDKSKKGRDRSHRPHRVR